MNAFVDSEHVNGAAHRIDFDEGSVRDAGGGVVRPDHSRKTKLARHDRCVAQRATFLDHECSDHG
jgi:hypothetical protein